MNTLQYFCVFFHFGDYFFLVEFFFVSLPRLFVGMVYACFNVIYLIFIYREVQAWIFCVQ